MTSPYVRLHLFFATENDRAVIVRQGPSKHYRMILWHRDTDTFEDGQWLKQRVYIDRCDLAPDGQHFIYFTLSGHWTTKSEGAYTVISQPPYFTGLSLFPEGSTWGGGGRFIDAKRYVAPAGKDIIGRARGLTRLTRTTKTKSCLAGLLKPDGKPANVSELGAARADAPVAHSTGVALDRYDTNGGKLYRRLGDDFELIRDFTDMSFEPVRAPYDWRDEDAAVEPAPWHPLNYEGKR